jgi:hypothetical protein
MTEPVSLDALQDFVARHVRSLRHLPNDATASAEAAAYLTGNDRLSPVEQLDVYRVQFWLRHTSALLEDFPGVSGVLGQLDWEGLVESYLSELPPESYTLRNLGERFARHIEGRPSLPNQALCVDMARLEWAYVEVFDATDSPPLDSQKLATLPEEAWLSARFVCSRALRLLQVRYPVAALRRDLRRAQRERGAKPVPIPAPSAQWLALYRGADRELYFKALSKAAYGVLNRLAAGEPLVPACEATAAEDPALGAEIEQDVGEWFRDWGQRGFFSDVSG